MFADAEDIETDLIGKFDFFEQLLHAVDGLQGSAGDGVRDGCGETIDSYFHVHLSLSCLLLDVPLG
jgi:hypothetical protein